MESSTKIILFNIIGLIAGLIVGFIVNMGIISISGFVIPYPEGYINTDGDSMKATFHLLEPKHMLMPWLAHGLGTLAGTFVAVKIVKSYQLTFSLIIGGLFLAGGTYMVIELSSPMWFNIVDLGFAYIPMAWIGYILASKNKV